MIERDGGEGASAPAAPTAAGAPIERSDGVLVAPLGDRFAAYDLVADRVSVLGPLAGWVLAGAPGSWCCPVLPTRASRRSPRPWCRRAATTSTTSWSAPTTGDHLVRETR